MAEVASVNSAPTPNTDGPHRDEAVDETASPPQADSVDQAPAQGEAPEGAETKYVDPEAQDPKNSSQNLKRIAASNQSTDQTEPQFNDEPTAVLNVGDKWASDNSQPTIEASKGDIRYTARYKFDDTVEVTETGNTQEFVQPSGISRPINVDDDWEDFFITPSFISESPSAWHSSPPEYESVSFRSSNTESTFTPSMRFIKLRAYDVHSPPPGGQPSCVEIYDANGNLITTWELKSGTSEKVLEVPEGAEIVAKSGDVVSGKNKTRENDNFGLEIYEEKKDGADKATGSEA